MIKTILKRWLSRLVPALTVIMAAVGVFHSVWRLVAGIAFVGLGMACIVKCIFWPDKDEPVTQPVQPATTMIPMPTVHLEPVTQPLPAIEVVYREALEDAFKDDDGYWSDGVEV